MVLDRFRRPSSGARTAAPETAGMPPAAAALAAALAPPEALVYDGSDAPASAAVARLDADDPGPLAVLLAATRAERAWDRRSRVVHTAAQARSVDQGPLRTWAQHAPTDPDAALVLSAALLQLAWRSRAGQDTAAAAPPGAFNTLVAAALPAVAQALRLGAGDPVAYEIALEHARASAAAREVFYDLCQGAEQADPLHLGWHTAALRYLSARWHGSVDEMWLYADAVSEAAPASARVALLPAVALSDIWRDDTIRFGPEGGPGQAFVRERFDVALHRANAHIGTLAGNDPARTEAIAVLAHLFGLAGLPAQAYDGFAAIGADVTALPWGSYAEPVAAFLEFRHDAVLARAAGR